MCERIFESSSAASLGTVYPWLIMVGPWVSRLCEPLLRIDRCFHSWLDPVFPASVIGQASMVSRPWDGDV